MPEKFRRTSMRTENSKPVYAWLNEIPPSEFRQKLFDVLQDRLGVHEPSLAKVVDLAYLMMAYEPECPFWYGATMYFDGETPPDGIPDDDLAYKGYKMAKAAMEVKP